MTITRWSIWIMIVIERSTWILITRRSTWILKITRWSTWILMVIERQLKLNSVLSFKGWHSIITYYCEFQENKYYNALFVPWRILLRDILYKIVNYFYALFVGQSTSISCIVQMDGQMIKITRPVYMVRYPFLSTSENHIY